VSRGRQNEGKRVRMLPNETLIPLVLLTALLLVFSLHTLAASGQFPREHRTPALASGFGVIVLYGTIAVAIASLMIALLAAWRLIPWYAAVIGGGLAILAAPLVLQQFPDRFVDGRASLLSFAAAGALLALLIWLGVGGRSDGKSIRGGENDRGYIRSLAQS